MSNRELSPFRVRKPRPCYYCKELMGISDMAYCRRYQHNAGICEKCFKHGKFVVSEIRRIVYGR